MTEQNKYTLIVVGSGGTGTYFLKEVSRYLSFKDRKKIRSMIIVDGDIIEKKNLSRQAFMEEDLQRNKAVVMAEVLNEAFHLNWKAYDQYLFNKEQLRQLVEATTIPIIIGCVDNHGCRLVIEEYFRSVNDCLYFDAANEEHSGETVFSAVLKGVCFSPCRSYYFPDILKGDTRNRDEIGCEELNTSAPQHLLANMSSAIHVLTAFINFFEKEIVATGFSVYNCFEYSDRYFSAKDCKWVPCKREEIDDKWLHVN